jgi:hypothetical protein
MKVKRYKNGNFTIQREKDEKLVDDANLIIAIAWHVPDMDLLGEPGCAGNYDMYQCFYNYYTGKKYMVLHSEQDDFEQGKIIRLYAQDMDEDDYALLEENCA